MKMCIDTAKSIANLVDNIDMCMHYIKSEICPVYYEDTDAYFAMLHHQVDVCVTKLKEQYGIEWEFTDE